MTGNQDLIVELLCGRTVHDMHGLSEVIYLEEGSYQELEARRALANVLRSSKPLDLGLRTLLADLFDPDRDEIDRKLRFVHRRKGKPWTKAQAEKQIAEFIWAAVQEGTKGESAFSLAMGKFGLKRTRIIEIWSHWQPILTRLKRKN